MIFYQISRIFVHKKTSENVVWKMPRPICYHFTVLTNDEFDKSSKCDGTLYHEIVGDGSLKDNLIEHYNAAHKQCRINLPIKSMYSLLPSEW